MTGITRFYFTHFGDIWAAYMVSILIVICILPKAIEEKCLGKSRMQKAVYYFAAFAVLFILHIGLFVYVI